MARLSDLLFEEYTHFDHRCFVPRRQSSIMMEMEVPVMNVSQQVNISIYLLADQKRTDPRAQINHPVDFDWCFTLTQFDKETV